MPGTSLLVFAAVLHQIILDGNVRKWLTRENEIEPLCSRMLVEAKPAEALVAGEARGNLKRHVGLHEVSGLIELHIRIDHYRIAAVRRVKDVKVPVNICFQQNAHPISLMKVMIWIDAHRQSVRVTHKKREPNADALNHRSLLYRIALGLLRCLTRACLH